MATSARTSIGIIGGVGQRELLRDAREIRVDTPYGPTSGPLAVGTLGGRSAAFVLRRGDGNAIQPHLVPYRANVWALASLGVTTLLTTTAGGGLREQFRPGVFVVTDQLVDYTTDRADTFYDVGPAVQLSAPDPFDPVLRGLAVDSLLAQGVRHRDFGTALVTQGPRFATRAESRLHAGVADIVVQTLLPETVLALELGMAVMNLTFVTDSDATDHDDVVTADLIARRIAQAQPVIRRTLTDVARTLPDSFRAASTVPQAAIDAVLARRAVTAQEPVGVL